MIDAVLQRETERTVKIGLIGLPKQRVGSSNLLSRSNLILNWSDKQINPPDFMKCMPYVCPLGN